MAGGQDLLVGEAAGTITAAGAIELAVQVTTRGQISLGVFDQKLVEVAWDQKLAVALKWSGGQLNGGAQATFGATVTHYEPEVEWQEIVPAKTVCVYIPFLGWRCVTTPAVSAPVNVGTKAVSNHYQAQYALVVSNAGVLLTVPLPHNQSLTLHAL